MYSLICIQQWTKTVWGESVSLWTHGTTSKPFFQFQHSVYYLQQSTADITIRSNGTHAHNHRSDVSCRAAFTNTMSITAHTHTLGPSSVWYHIPGRSAVGANTTHTHSLRWAQMLYFLQWLSFRGRFVIPPQQVCWLYKSETIGSQSNITSSDFAYSLRANCGLLAGSTGEGHSISGRLGMMCPIWIRIT